MAEKFIGEVKTLWNINHRDMTLLEPFTYVDPDGTEWNAPAGSFLNGATIPRSLWTIIGSPYTGSYRRASIIHDYFVGEGGNPTVTPEARKKADKMFYHACKYDGCSNREASVLYIGVRIGTWYSTKSSLDNEAIFESVPDQILESPSDIHVKGKFRKVYYNLEDNLDNITIDELEKSVDGLLLRESIIPFKI